MEESFLSLVEKRFNYQDGLEELNTILDSIPELYGTHNALFNLTKLNGKFYVSMYEKGIEYHLKELDDEEKSTLMIKILSYKAMHKLQKYGKIRTQPLFTSKVEDGKMFQSNVTTTSVKTIFKDNKIYFLSNFGNNINVFNGGFIWEPFDKEEEIKRIIENGLSEMKRKLESL